MIHFDTSFLIRSLLDGSAENELLGKWRRQQTELGASAICWAEFLCGPVAGAQVILATQFLGEPIAYTRAAAEQTAILFNLARRRRGLMLDCMIAAVTLVSGARLATSNPEDFRLFEAAGLQIITP